VEVEEAAVEVEVEEATVEVVAVEEAAEVVEALAAAANRGRSCCQSRSAEPRRRQSSPATVEVRVTTNCGSSALAGPRRRS
jgi:hypothetical protein